MQTVASWIDTMDCDVQDKTELHSRVLRNKLINLTLDWELAALTLDSQRYKSENNLERETYRDSANIYRKCISEVSELLSAAMLTTHRTKI